MFAREATITTLLLVESSCFGSLPAPGRNAKWKKKAIPARRDRTPHELCRCGGQRFEGVEAAKYIIAGDVLPVGSFVPQDGELEVLERLR